MIDTGALGRLDRKLWFDRLSLSHNAFRRAIGDFVRTMCCRHRNGATYCIKRAYSRLHYVFMHFERFTEFNLSAGACVRSGFGHPRQSASATGRGSPAKRCFSRASISPRRACLSENTIPEKTGPRAARDPGIDARYPSADPRFQDAGSRERKLTRDDTEKWQQKSAKTLPQSCHSCNRPQETVTQGALTLAAIFWPVESGRTRREP